MTALPDADQDAGLREKNPFRITAGLKYYSIAEHIVAIAGKRENNEQCNDYYTQALREDAARVVDAARLIDTQELTIDTLRSRANAAETELDQAFASAEASSRLETRQQVRAMNAEARATAAEDKLRDREAEIERLTGENDMLREVQEAVIARWRGAAFLAVNGDMKRLQRLLMASQSRIAGSALASTEHHASSEEATDA